jgi:hypothetical protein
MNLVGQVFIVMVVVVALMQSKTTLETFATDEYLDLPRCENINNIVSL